MSLTEDILNSIDIIDIISQYVDLKKSWRNYIWLCPFHNEKTPSFVVSEDKQIFKCFWCWKWWNVITFLKEIENIEFYDAIKILAEKSGIELKNYNNDKTQNKKEIDLKDKLIKINKTALNFFHKKLFEYENAFNYLTQNRKLSKEIIIKYKLWYAPTKWIELINYLKQKWFDDEDIILSWLWRKSSSWSIYSFFSNRIIFPIFSSLWDVIAFSWRIFNWEENTWKYINTPETILYHKSNILYNFNNAKKTKKDYLIIVEWYMDVIWLDRLGYDNALATCWTALTEQHIKLLKRVSNKIVFAFDNDNAWEQATIRWLKIAISMEIYPMIFQIKWWKDFDEIADNKKNINIIENTKDGISFIINKILDNYNNNWPIEKQKKLEQVFEILKNIWNYNIFWDYLEKAWKIINQDPNILYQQLKSKKNYRKKDNNKSDDKKKYIIPALFYNNFLNQYKNINIDEIIQNILEILDILPENSILKSIFTWKIQDNDKTQILEQQLNWEQKLTWWTNDKIQTTITNETKKYIIQIITNLIKDPNIEHNKKIKLIKVLNKIRK